MKLGRYEVVSELGKGAMGIVYLGRDPVIGRMVALKTIRQTKNPDDEVKEFHQRFVREAQAAGVLSHPAIVTVHDIGEDSESGTHFIAMEYVEGPNLKEILSQGTPLTFEQVASVVSQVAEALDYAHTKGIVHRDVKPANIIWCGDSKVKITDFGIAKIASSANLTSTGQFLGTPNYMAPEQIKGAPVDGRSDIFSLGIVLYECLTRKKPFGGDSLTTISYRIVHEPFPRLREVNSSIPVEFEEIVQRCLEKNPNNRYQRGLEVSRALSAIGRATKGFSSTVPPLLADETILTRQDVDRERIATVEMPFPEVGDTALATVGPEPPGPARLAVRKFPVSIVTGPILKRKIPAAVFWGASLLLLFAIGISAAKIRSAHVEVPSVDTRRETLVARQRALRNEGNELVRVQNVEGAYQKFLQLAQIAPASQWVRSQLSKLDSVRGKESDRRQRKADALGKIEEGKQLMGKKDYAGATAVFGEAFVLDPDSDEATELLKAAQLEQQKELEAQEQKLVLGGRTLTAAIKPRVVTRPPKRTKRNVAVLETRFDSPVADGYLLVKVDGETMVYQNVWEEKGRLYKRKTPKNVRVKSEVRPRSSEIVVYLVIPSLKYQDSSVLRVAFRAGTAHVLTVKFNPRTRMMEAKVS